MPFAGSDTDCLIYLINLCVLTASPAETTNQLGHIVLSFAQTLSEESYLCYSSDTEEFTHDDPDPLFDYPDSNY
jgi:hypothetical protein